MAVNLLIGLAATTLAALQCASWIAIGSFLFHRDDGFEFPAPAAMVFGSAVTGTVLAVFCWLGYVNLAIAASALVSLGALAIRRDQVAREIAAIREEWSMVSRSSPAAHWLAIGGLVVAWILAIAPPRDADVLRYHLTHVRQIVSDGAWLPIPDYHYAFPFGWSFNYLPFERIHLPAAAQLLDLGAFLLTLLTIAHVIRRTTRNTGVAAWMSALLMFSPPLLKIGTTASADAITMLTVAAIVSAALLDGPTSSRWTGGLALLAWVGLQSRYQAGAISIGVTAMWLFGVARGYYTFRAWSFAAGMLLAGVLCAPFYAFNYLTFHNPVWPLFANAFSQVQYADVQAVRYTSRVVGRRSLYAFGRAFYRAFQFSYGFPSAQLAMLAPLTLVKWRSRATELLLVFLFGYLIAWYVMQPGLSPRYYVYVIAPAAVLVAMLAGDVHAWVGAREWAGRSLTWAPVIALIGVCAVYSYDQVVYFVGRDADRYHRFTWFYEPETWLSARVAANQRVLAVLNSAQTYYLDVPNRRADPCFSAVADWRSFKTSSALGDWLHEERYQYVLYDTQNWDGCAGGRELMTLIADAQRSGVLHEVKAFEVPLAMSRMRRDFQHTRVVVLELKEPAAGSSETRLRWPAGTD
jgi:hypothetical protein